MKIHRKVVSVVGLLLSLSACVLTPQERYTSPGCQSQTTQIDGQAVNVIFCLDRPATGDKQTIRFYEMRDGSNRVEFDEKPTDFFLQIGNSTVLSKKVFAPMTFSADSSYGKVSGSCSPKIVLSTYVKGRKGETVKRSALPAYLVDACRLSEDSSGAASPLVLRDECSSTYAGKFRGEKQAWALGIDDVSRQCEVSINGKPVFSKEFLLPRPLPSAK